jgi:hypothetical protein
LGIHVRKWLFSSPSRSHPAAGITQYMAQRGFAQERPEDSSTSNWGAGEPPIDEKNTERGVAPGSQESQHLQQQQSGSSSSNNHPNLSTDSEGQTNTPNLSEEQTTRDFINIQREARTHVAEVPTYTNKDSFFLSVLLSSLRSSSHRRRRHDAPPPPPHQSFNYICDSIFDSWHLLSLFDRLFNFL